MTVIRPMFPPRQTDTASIVDDHPVPLKFIAEFAASLVCDDMDANGAQEGYFHIRRDEGERLAWHDRRDVAHILAKKDPGEKPTKKAKAR
jgi:hypothetical protein